MGSGLRFVAAGMFMVAAAVLVGHAQNARGDEGILPGIGAGFSALMVLVLITWGVIAGIREHWKVGP